MNREGIRLTKQTRLLSGAESPVDSPHSWLSLLPSPVDSAAQWI